MILLIDNYDSFTWNLVHFLGELGAECQVVRNDQLTVDEALAVDATAVILSPGPCAPDTAGICVDLIKAAPEALPILGVCLGHQSIGQATGGKIVRAKRLMHGKTDQIHHNGESLFDSIPNPMTATRYHSLVIRRDTLSDEFEVIAWADSPTGDKEIMAIRHQEYPTFGVQFHPESFLTEGGIDLLKNFIGLTP